MRVVLHDGKSYTLPADAFVKLENALAGNARFVKINGDMVSVGSISRLEQGGTVESDKPLALPTSPASKETREKVRAMLISKGIL